jgi:hypothetical protein
MFPECIIRWVNVPSTFPEFSPNVPCVQVVMAFGEIDCREGMLVSVNRDRYKDLAEAMQV